ncbi:hypothetical protein C8J56DRAFT_1083078 [Mycena floridula]|nr:hypothetical protein C8J56DRAFT_1083078 [Mycena floridula]
MSQEMQPGPLADSDIFALKVALLIIAIQSLFYGIYSALVIIVLYKLWTNKVKLAAHSILIAAVISMFATSTTPTFVDLAFSLIQLPAFGVDPPNVVRPLIKMQIVDDTMLRLNYLIGDFIVVWRAWILWTNHPRVHMLMCICLFGTFAYKVWEYKVEIKQNLGLSHNKMTKVERVLILLMESGSIYCLIWLTTLVFSLTNSDDEALSSQIIRAILPMLVEITLGKTNLESSVNGSLFSQSLQFASRPQVSTATQSDNVAPGSTTSHINSAMPDSGTDDRSDPATDDRLGPTIDNRQDSNTNAIAVAEPLGGRMEKHSLNHSS